jgi:hypothetical protein
MKHLLATLLLATACAVSGYGQTIKTLGFNTTNGQVVYSGTNVLTFLNSVRIEEQGGDGATIESGGGRLAVGGVQIDIVNSNVNLLWPIAFDSEELAAATRTNLGLGATWLTNDNVTNFRTAIGLGATNDVFFSSVRGGSQTNNQVHLDNAEFQGEWTFLDALTIDVAINFTEGEAAAITRTNLGLGATNNVTFKQIIATDGTNDIVTIAQSNAALFFRDFDGAKDIFFFDSTADQARARTNLGLPLPALTNTNVSNFRAAIGLDGTNASPVEYASVLFDSARSENGLEIDDGSWVVSAYSTLASAPTNTTNAVLWIEVTDGTNSYRLPLFQ